MTDETKTEDIKTPDIPTEDILKEAREITQRNEKAVAEFKSLVQRQEELAARNLLGGKTDAGIQPAKPAEISPKEYADLALKGKVGK